MSATIEALKAVVNEAWENRDLLASAEVKKHIAEVIALLDTGKIRVAEKIGDAWVTHEWIKKAILLYFIMREPRPMVSGMFEYYDKIPVKRGFAAQGVRVVPPATIRYGAYVAPGCVVMPSYINIGAYVDEGTMVDTWATVGSCAQIGKRVHISGGVGIGGVLEPPQAQPVIIEDDVFIGSRCVVVEGVIVEKEAVLGAGVVLTASTKIIDVTSDEPVVYRGRVPARSVVIPGSYAKQFPAGTYQVPCALIIGRRSESTDKKVSLNEALRTFEVPV